MASNVPSQRVKVDKKTFVRMYENMDCSCGFYLLSEGIFKRPVSFTNNRFGYDWYPEDFDVGFLFKPIKHSSQDSDGGDNTKKEIEKQEKIDISSHELEELLENLNTCLEDANLKILEDELIDKKNLKKDPLVVGLGIHLIRKLSGKTETNFTKAEKTACPCKKFPELCGEKQLTAAKMFIGSEETWHGELDLFAHGVGVIAAKAVTEAGHSSDNNEGSQDEGTNSEVKTDTPEWTGMSQAIAQAIVFGWTEFNSHKTLSPLIPTVFINDQEFVFLIYNPTTDALMGPRKFVRFINKKINDPTDVRRYLGIVLLWVVLNHRFFFVNDLKGCVDPVSCGFSSKVNVHPYEKLQEFRQTVRVSDDSKMEHGDIFLSTKRKKPDDD